MLTDLNLDNAKPNYLEVVNLFLLRYSLNSAKVIFQFLLQFFLWRKSLFCHVLRKKLFIYKPDSVPPQYILELGFRISAHSEIRNLQSEIYWGGVYHLSTFAVTDEMNLPTPRAVRAAQWRYRSSPFAVYVAFQPTRFIRVPICIGTLCALTAHFHPYPVRFRLGDVGFRCKPKSPIRNRTRR